MSESSSFTTDLIDETPIKRPRGNPNWLKNKKPSAVPARQVTWQDPGSRGKVLLDKYGPAEIIKFATSSIKKTPLSTQDYQLVKQLARTFESGDELERFNNRSFGKVPDKQINLNVNLDVSPEQLSERALALLATIAPD
jgi:hypothetical protein